MKTPALTGRGIVITRPAGEAQRLADLVRVAGGRPILFPAIDILDVTDPAALNGIIARLDGFDIAIFVSPNSVRRAMQLIATHRVLPQRLQCAAIGGGSLRALESFGVRGTVAPHDRHDSEALLALPLLRDVAGKRVVIFRGEGGRELLADALATRGALVEYAECYRRARPREAPATLLADWARGDVAACVFTSSEGLRNVFEVIGKAGQALLRTTPVFVPHPRIAGTARELELAQVVETGSGDDAVVEALVRYFRAA